MFVKGYKIILNGKIYRIYSWNKLLFQRLKFYFRLCYKFSVKIILKKNRYVELFYSMFRYNIKLQLK